MYVYAIAPPEMVQPTGDFLRCDSRSGACRESINSKYTAAIEQQAQKCQAMLAETSVRLEATQSELEEAKKKHKAEVAHLKEVAWCARVCAKDFQDWGKRLKLKLASMEAMHMES